MATMYSEVQQYYGPMQVLEAKAICNGAAVTAMAGRRRISVSIFAGVTLVDDISVLLSRCEQEDLNRMSQDSRRWIYTVVPIVSLEDHILGNGQIRRSRK